MSSTPPRIAALLALALVAAGCADPEPVTETVVVVDAESGVRTGSTHLQITIYGRSGIGSAWTEREQRTVAMDGTEGRYPLFLTLVPKSNEASRQLRVDVNALAGGAAGTTVASARVITGFVARTTRVAEVRLEDDCRGIGCAETETCHDAVCGQATVDASTLPEPEGGTLDRCLYANGGCDPVVTCTAEAASVVCGACPQGFVGTGDTDCLFDDPRLAGLVPSSGRLVPAFDANASELTVRLRVDRTSVTLTPTLPDPTGAVVRVNGAVVASSAASAPLATALGTTDATVTVESETGKSKTYTVHLVREVEFETYVKAPMPEADARFGSGLNASGDTIVVGAAYEDSGLAAGTTLVDSGAVYVYRLNADATVSLEQKLKAPNAGAGDNFGWETAIDGDTLVVSAPYEDSDATTVGGDMSNDNRQNAGALYVYRRSGTTWTLEAYLKVPTTELDHTLGQKIAIDGNVIVAGTPYDDGPTGATPNAGVVYVFERVGTTWTLTATLRGSNTTSNDRFGLAVDVDGNTIVAGAYTEDGSASGVNGNANALDPVNFMDAGAAYVFERQGTGAWGQTTYLKSSYPAAGDNFGLSVGISGTAIVVGAQGEDSNSTASNPDPSIDGLSSSGGAFVFTRPTVASTSWSLTGFLKAPNPGMGDNFGGSVRIDGDLLLLTASFEDGSGRGVNPASDELATDAGAMYLFRRSGNTFVFHAYLKPSNTDAGDSFRSVGLTQGLLVGTSRFEDGNGLDPADNSVTDSGAFYVYE